MPELEPAALSLLTDESEDVAHALSEDELDYLPLLPDDEHLLQERVQALQIGVQALYLGLVWLLDIFVQMKSN